MPMVLLFLLSLVCNSLKLKLTNGFFILSKCLLSLKVYSCHHFFQWTAQASSHLLIPVMGKDLNLTRKAASMKLHCCSQGQSRYGLMDDTLQQIADSWVQESCDITNEVSTIVWVDGSAVLSLVPRPHPLTRKGVWWSLNAFLVVPS